ncbi:hypothetical protein C8Q73DRAFT_368149 [Cubamyces lactineus]|nr:hypothetical protein C8Q73DRAFT_368149 [Cubamyces lactineus]
MTSPFASPPSSTTSLAASPSTLASTLFFRPSSSSRSLRLAIVAYLLSSPARRRSIGMHTYTRGDLPARDCRFGYSSTRRRARSQAYHQPLRADVCLIILPNGLSNGRSVIFPIVVSDRGRGHQEHILLALRSSLIPFPRSLSRPRSCSRWHAIAPVPAHSSESFGFGDISAYSSGTPLSTAGEAAAQPFPPAQGLLCDLFRSSGFLPTTRAYALLFCCDDPFDTPAA